MPWKKVLPLEQRTHFVLKVKEKQESFAALCKLFGISRRTGYLWWGRYFESGLKGLKERSHRVKKCPHETGRFWVKRAVALRRLRGWGSKKILGKFVLIYGNKDFPSSSTIDRILTRAGLVPRRSRRYRRYQAVPRVQTQAVAPNDVWPVDFKGWFRTADNIRCDTLTVTDLFSRFILCCRILPSQKTVVVKAAFRRLFKKYGLPKVIRVDNGIPFAGRGLGGLSELSVWWVSLGICPEFIEPGRPDQNGSQERMHRTLKAEATQPPSKNDRAQQKRFNRWTKHFNEQRPHEALQQRYPCMLYKPSPRVFCDPSPPRYPAHFEIRRVRTTGEVRWNGKLSYIGESFCGQILGFKRFEKTTFETYFYQRLIGLLRENAAGGLIPLLHLKNKKVLPIS